MSDNKKHEVNHSSNNSPQSEFPSSSSTRIQISMPAAVSARGRKKLTPSSAGVITAPSRLPLSSSKTAKAPPPPAATTTTLPKPISSNTSSTVNIKPKKKNKKKWNEWPSSSADCLPELSTKLLQRLQDKDLDFKINGEVTSLKFSPSGRLLVAAFSDGTVRLFDLSGSFNNGSHTGTDSSSCEIEAGLFDMDSSSEDDSVSLDGSSAITSPSAVLSPHVASMSATTASSATKTKRNHYVLSKENQRYGAVVAQIHAKGVITSLLMDVDVSQDGQYCFAGALRGSMELMAIYLGDIEKALDDMNSNVDLLDLSKVFCKSDAKLRGFGACTLLKNGSKNAPPQYLLLTGTGIKNVHVWKFVPELDNRGQAADNEFSQRDTTNDDAFTLLYDFSSNGTSITHLGFRFDPNGLLQGISKSDSQRLRVWDLSYEQHRGNSKHPLFKKRSVIQKFAEHQEKQPVTIRPKKPQCVDVSNSEATLNVCGGFAVCCGGSSMSLVNLDDIDSPFNHSELAIPGLGGSGMASRGSRRQQRGELKEVTSVAGLACSSECIILEVSDGSMARLSHDDGNGQPTLEMTQLFAETQQDGISRKICLGKIGAQGVVAAALASYNSAHGKGKISVKPLYADALKDPTERRLGFWGFLPQFQARNKTTKQSGTVSNKSLSAETPFTEPSGSEHTKSLTYTSPRGGGAGSEISNWTHPPSEVADKGAVVAATPTLGRSDGVKLFESSKKAPVPSHPNQKVASTNAPLQVGTASKQSSKVSSRPASKENTPTIHKLASQLASSSKMPSRAVATSVVTAKKQPAVKSGATMTPRLPPKPISSKQVSKATQNISVDPYNQQQSKQPSKSTSKKRLSLGGSSSATALQKRRANEITPSSSNVNAKKKSRTTPETPLAASKVSPEVSPDFKGTPALASQKNDHQKDKDVTQYSANNLAVVSQSPGAIIAETPIPRKPSKVALETNDLQEVANALCTLGSTTKTAPSTAKKTPARSKSPRPSKVAKKVAAKEKRPFSDLFYDECHKKADRLDELQKLHLPNSTVEARLGLTSLSSSAAGSASTAARLSHQEQARMQLAAQHRASHEQLLKRVLQAAKETVTIFAKAKTVSIIDQEEEDFREVFREYYEMLDQTLWRQNEEARTLATQQTLELWGILTPVLQVAFPFYGVFDEVIAGIDSITAAARGGH